MFGVKRSPSHFVGKGKFSTELEVCYTNAPNLLNEMGGAQDMCVYRKAGYHYRLRYMVNVRLFDSEIQLTSLYPVGLID